MSDQIVKHLQQLSATLGTLNQKVQRLENAAKAPQLPLSQDQEIDGIVGRRVPFNAVGTGVFDLTLLGKKGQPINIQVNSDGPFIQTAYPLICWTPTSPPSATNFGKWRPVCSANLSAQAVGQSGVDLQDTIDISYEIQDGGNQRNLQNVPTPPLLSRFDKLLPLPTKMIWQSSSVISISITYRDINFSAAVPPDAGEISVILPGLRVVLM